jgi:hypothetical protein
MGKVHLLLTLLLAGCSSTELRVDPRDNNGSNLTTAAGEPLDPAMFYGKWDLDGERTNTMNGAGGVIAIPSDILKDIFGKGWKFEPGGILKTDVTGGYKVGTWRVEPPATLVVREDESCPDGRFEASFREGYLYLRSPGGRYAVMERDKFFGF